MTVNLFCVTKGFAICVADRRLTYASGPMASDRAKKILCIQCQDAQLIAAFNGYAGKGLGDSPIDWMLRAGDLGCLRVLDLIDRIKSILENNLKTKPRDVARLSFTLTGFAQGRPVLVHISNYEFLRRNEVLNVAQEIMEIETFTGDFFAVQTGVSDKQKEVALRKAFKGYYEQGAASERVRNTMVKAVRDISYSRGRDKEVGVNCHSVTLNTTGGYESLLHTKGGTTVSEHPDFISSGPSFSNIMVDTNPSEDGPAWGHPTTRSYAKLLDQTCDSCENPIPPGQKQCGVCDARTTKK